MRKIGLCLILGSPLAPALGRCAETSAPSVLDTLDSGSSLHGLPLDKILQTGGALVLVLVVIAALAWILRRYRQSSNHERGELALLGGLALGGRERLVLVRAGRDRLLIGVAPGQIRAIHVLSETAPAPETRTEPAVGFEHTLNGILASDRP